MPDLVVAALLGLVQGLTEFLPVSSTAHLVAAERILRLDPARFGLPFAVAVHLGTALAVLLYFAGTWLGLARDALAGRWRLPLLVAAGTLPAAAAGLVLQSAVEGALRDVRVVAAALVAGSLVIYLAERRATQERGSAGLTWRDALLMGAAQAVALVPGISRSGITISTGLLLGLSRPDATRFSFLLATPVIAGAGLRTVLDARSAADLLADPAVAAVGFTASALSGLVAVAFLMRFLRTRPLTWFVPYRLALAAVLVIAALAGAA